MKKTRNSDINLLEMSHQEARAFLLKGDSYCMFDLPKYFEFDKLIGKISRKLSGTTLGSFYKQIPKLDKTGKARMVGGTLRKCADSPKNYDDVSYELFTNKDGKYAWRPLQLIHPALYVSLVHRLTEKESWEDIKARFVDFTSNKKIQCVSLPIRSGTAQSDQAQIVIRWWHKVEQQSIEMAMDYQYLFATDISDCYGSMYTHSIPWAMHGKDVAKTTQDSNKLIGNVIDWHLQDMSFGQTNGIPQGSMLMDFIAEIVLGYVDLLLTDKIDKSIRDYRIIRYRDDYKVFVNNPKDGEAILKAITEVLAGLGMKLNPHKTLSSHEIVRDSLKEDKWHWIEHDKRTRNLQKHILVIHLLSQRHPNSGSLAKALTGFMKRIMKLSKTPDAPVVLISIVTDIALKNPRVYPICAAILSRLLSYLGRKSMKRTIIKKIRKRCEELPNTGHLELWLQRIEYGLDPSSEFKEDLCKLVYGADVTIWNSRWLKTSFANIIDPSDIINQEELLKMALVIAIDEVALFDPYD